MSFETFGEAMRNNLSDFRMNGPQNSLARLTMDQWYEEFLTYISRKEE